MAEGDRPAGGGRGDGRRRRDRGRPTSGGGRADESASEPLEVRRLRRRIDALDHRIVRLLNERAELGREVGRAKLRDGRRRIRDAERERQVLLRVAMANAGPIRQADLLAIYRRLMAATRALERADRAQAARDALSPGDGSASGRPPEDAGPDGAGRDGR
jgi:chorismate mutase